MGWNRREGTLTQSKASDVPEEEVAATCSCGSGIPIQKINVNGKEMTLVALPLIFQNFHEAKKFPSEPVLSEMMEMVKIYNGIEPADEVAILQEISREYQAFWQKQLVKHE